MVCPPSRVRARSRQGGPRPQGSGFRPAWGFVWRRRTGGIRLACRVRLGPTPARTLEEAGHGGAMEPTSSSGSLRVAGQLLVKARVLERLGGNPYDRYPLEKQGQVG